MGVYLYDEALVAKVKKWTEKAKVEVFDVDDTKRLFEVIADKTKDKPIKLPIITIDRPKGYRIINTTKKPMTFDGATLQADCKKALQLNAIPIEVSYTIDVYARYYKEADIIMRDLIYNFVNHPKIQVKIPYKDADVVHDANFILNQDISDSSGVSQRLDIGQFYKLSLSLTLDEAYLWDCRIRNVISIIDDSLEVDD